MHEKSLLAELQVGPQGRVVIPASLRHTWQLKTGEKLVVYLEDDRLIMEKPANIAQRAKQRFSALYGQPSLANELIAERQREAAVEESP
ncbi:MAG: AbrB/MazE/SpoVT family DNA-binding domain-containing protein [Anaerolineae bacterium]